MTKRVVKNRGLGKYLDARLPGWHLSKQFTALSILPLIQTNFPNADRFDVNNALVHCAKRGTAVKVARGLYAKPNGIAPQAELVFEREANLDEVLNAMVVMEAFIRQHREMIGLIKQIKGNLK